MRKTIRLFSIGLLSFLTLVDLFATQAVLPSLAQAYDVSPAVIASAVNACTIGMVAAGIAVAVFHARIGRRAGIVFCLASLAVPTCLLAFMPPLPLFAALRILQGLFMSAAFSLAIAYIGENFDREEGAAAVAAYVTGNVLSNLAGRLMAAAVVDHLGLPANFLFFAGLNLAGAALAYFTLQDAARTASSTSQRMSWAPLFRRRELLLAYGVGFLILFCFIATFTYINFVLAGPFGLSRMQIGFVYFVFLPAVFSTPAAGFVLRYVESRKAMTFGLLSALLGLPLLLSSHLSFIFTGLALVAAGTFFAQAIAPGYVGRAAGKDRAAASGIYLAAYYSGGLAGTVVMGFVFDRLGWPLTVAGIGLGLLVSAVGAAQLLDPHRTIQQGVGRAESLPRRT